MDGYEIIQRNINFDFPERVGLRFNSLGVSDVQRIYLQPSLTNKSSSNSLSMLKKIRTRPGEKDEWGCQWDAIGEAPGDDMGQVLDPPIKSLDQIEDYPFPDAFDTNRFIGLEDALSHSDGKFVQLNSPFCLFERMHFLRGFEGALEDFALQPEKTERFLDKIIEFQIGIAEVAGKLGKGRIHCFDTTDDWGTQTNLFVSPKMWRKFIKPRYKKLIDVIHNNGMVLRFHSDGKINAILEDLVEIGVDILNIHQPLLLGIEEVSSKLQGRICFEASVDIQATLPSNDRDLIEEQVKNLIMHWATPKGGLIGVEYRLGAAVGIRKEALQWELEAFRRYGQF